MKKINQISLLYSVLISCSIGSTIIGIFAIFTFCKAFNVKLFNKNSLLFIIFSHNSLKILLSLAFLYFIEFCVFKASIYIYCKIADTDIDFIKISKNIIYVLIILPLIVLCLIILDYDQFTAIFSLLSFIILFVDLRINLLKKR